MAWLKAPCMVLVIKTNNGLTYNLSVVNGIDSSTPPKDEQDWQTWKEW